jgi:tetratricopeptide (TPR) repeat protein
MDTASKAIEEAILQANKSAVDNLRAEKYDHAMFFLNQALLAAKAMKDGASKYNLLGMTYNNLGCYLKRMQKPKQALDYFSKSIELSKLYDASIANLTCAHLNISKILSEQGEHERALRHGLKSLFLLRHNFHEKRNLVSSLIIAYQTVGLEYLRLHQAADSVECFETGLALSVKHLGKAHEVTLALQQSLDEAAGKSLRSQSHQSKKRSHARGRSAGIAKIGSSAEMPRPTPASAQKPKTLRATTRTGESRPVFRYNRTHIAAAAKIQRWWRNRYYKAKARKEQAAVKVQRWWRGIIGRAVEKERRAKAKRFVIKNPRTKQRVEEGRAKEIINERERRLLAGSTRLLQEIRRNEASREGSRVAGKNRADKVILEVDEEVDQTPISRVLPVAQGMQKKQEDAKENGGKTKQEVGKVERGCQNKGAEARKEKEGDRNEEKKETGKGANGKEIEGISRKSAGERPEDRKPSNPRPSTSGSEGKGRRPDPRSVKRVKEVPGAEACMKPAQNSLSNGKPSTGLRPLSNPAHASPANNHNGKLVQFASSQAINPEPAKKKAVEEKSIIDKGKQDLEKNMRRNYLAKKRADITNQINCLVKIQSFVRMVPHRIRYNRILKATKLIQKVYKGHLIRRLYQAIRDAVIFIQYMYRKFRSRQSVSVI